MKKINENAKITLTLGQLRGLVRESEEEREGYLVSIYEEVDEGGEEPFMEFVYDEIIDDYDEALDEAEKLVEKYKNKEGKFNVLVDVGFLDENGKWTYVTTLYSLSTANGRIHRWPANHINLKNLICTEGTSDRAGCSRSEPV